MKTQKEIMEQAGKLYDEIVLLKAKNHSNDELVVLYERLWTLAWVLGDNLKTWQKNIDQATVMLKKQMRGESL